MKYKMTFTVAANREKQRNRNQWLTAIEPTFFVRSVRCFTSGEMSSSSGTNNALYATMSSFNFAVSESFNSRLILVSRQLYSILITLLMSDSNEFGCSLSMEMAVPPLQLLLLAVQLLIASVWSPPSFLLPQFSSVNGSNASTIGTDFESLHGCWDSKGSPYSASSKFRTVGLDTLFI